MEAIQIQRSRYRGICGTGYYGMLRKKAQQNSKVKYQQQTKFIKKSVPVKLPKLPPRDIQIKMILLDSNLFEDNSLLLRQKCLNYKLHKFRIEVFRDGEINYLSFVYLDLDTGQEIQGNQMGSNSSLSYGEEQYQFQADQFAIGIQYNLEGEFKHLGFITSKERVVGCKGDGEIRKKLLPAGYHIGAISSSIDSYLQGIQFDIKLIPKQFRKKRPHLQNEKLLDLKRVFTDEKLFSYAIEFLSCRDIMRLFLVSKTVAEFRKTCEAYWLKCWNQCDKLMLAYLRGIASLYGIKDLIELLEKHRWNDIPLIADKPYQQQDFVRLRWSPDVIRPDVTSNYMKEGVTYLIVVGAVYLTQTNDQTYLLRLTDSQLETWHGAQQVQKALCDMQTTKISILVTWSPETMAQISKLEFVVDKLCLECYAMYTISSMNDVSNGFQAYKNGIFVKFTKGQILKQ